MIEAKYTSSQESSVVLDLAESLPLLTLDIISHLCLGESFHCVRNEKDQYGFLDALKTGMVAQQYISVLLEIKSFLFWIGKFSFVRSNLFPNISDTAGIGRVMMVCFIDYTIFVEQC